ncbi:ribulose bisphosphate carboxylase small subunit [Microcystis aeruginosa NIES-3806]|nr:ribulose bisphosphate carboxylase small subunit [Microcystis aeruginosa NIES-3806]
MMKSSVMVKAPAARPVAPKVAAGKSNLFKVWKEAGNKQFETFSFLPALSKEQISKQIDYIVNNGWVPCLEFAPKELAYVGNQNCDRVQVSPGYYDNRYWTMWKLPMFGCTDPSQVIGEIANCAKALPAAYIRIAAFDNIRQVQICSFLVQRPAGSNEWLAPNERQL